MKSIFVIAVLAVGLVVAPNSCFADWGSVPLSGERAKELGVEVRSKAAGAGRVNVEVEFKSEGEWKDIGRIDLRFGAGDDPAPTQSLEVDRSKPGRVAVRFTADRALLPQCTLEVWVRADFLGGTIYELRVEELVEPEKGR